MNIFMMANELEYRDIPKMAIAHADEIRDDVEKMHQSLRGLDIDGVKDIWYSKEGRVVINTHDVVEDELLGRWKNALASYGDVEVINGFGVFPNSDPNLVKVAIYSTAADLSRIKKAYSATARGIGQVLNFLPNPVNRLIGGPNPILAGLTSGMVGAGLGYGAGWVGEKILPEKWKRNRLRRTLAILGGLGGVGLGGLWAGSNVMAGKPWYSGSLVQGSPVPNVPPGQQLPWEKITTAFDKNAQFVPDRTGVGIIGRGEFDRVPPFPRNEFLYGINYDPRVAGRLSPAIRAATTGLIQGASMSGGGVRLIGLGDMARITAGMGSGYLAGDIIGRALGLMMGMPSGTQDRLKNTGMWAGIISNLVPLAFGR